MRWHLETTARWALMACCVLWFNSAWAAALPILPFSMDSWAKLSHSAGRPSIVVFSTTDCLYCPAVIDHLADYLKKHRAKARLLVVVMDGAEAGEALRSDPHYQLADALYVFNGNDMALRSTVNPQWRGITPYVAFMPATGTPQFTLGEPTAAALDAFLRH